MPVLAIEDARIESCDLQLGDTWRGMQGKMSVTAPDKKIRKKTDKPQSQINKCYNEKKRREQENETINQLEELLGTCLAEVKQPDKNGIVREATRQIQEVLQRRRECPGECPLRAAQSLSPVQAGEVSSTQPQPPCPGLHYTELTTLIEALKHYTGSLGWILLEINSEGEIECVTENIKDLILRDRTELYKKSIFSLLQVKDHAKLRPLLRSIQNFNWSSGEIDKFQAIQAGLIVKNSNGTESRVVEAVIHAAPVRGPPAEEAGSVMCVIRRCEDASAALIPVAGGPPAISAAKQADHIVFRLDCNYTILSCDLSGVENLVNPGESLVGTRYLELVEAGDRGRVAAHLQEAASPPAPPAVSEPFRLRVAAGRAPLRVAARSRLFRAKPTSGEPDFIMSTHSVLDDDAPDAPPAAAEPGREPRYRHHASPPAGHFSINDFDLDPWAASLLGDMAAEEPKERRDSSAGEGGSASRAPSTPGEQPPTPQHHHTQHSQQQHSQQQHTQQHHSQQQHSQQQHPQQQHSQQQHSLQQHPQQQHPQQQHPQQQHPQQQHPQQQHPQQQHPQQQHPQQHHPQQQHSQQQHSQQQQQLQHSQQQHSQQQHSQQQQQLEEPTRLRLILTGKKPENQILINILRQEDEEANNGGETSAPHTPHTPTAPLTPHTPSAAQSPAHARAPPHAHHAPHASHAPPQHSHAGPASHSHQQHNQMVRLLNDNTEDESEESRRGAGGRPAPLQSALLSQLLQPTHNGPANNGRSADNSESAYLEKMTTQKRKFEEAKGMATNAKRATPENQQVSSSALPAASASATNASAATSGGMSSLCQKNQILVSLLAREQSTPTTPPQLNSPGVRPYPPRARAPPHALPPRHHSMISEILAGNNHRMNVVNGGVSGVSAGAGAELRGSQLQKMLQQSVPGARYPPPHYAPRGYAQPPPPAHHNAGMRPTGAGGDGEVPNPDKTLSDKVLSDLLDDVLASMPDSDQQQEIEDRNAAVKAITASLMQCETKQPTSSPGTPPVYSVQSPGTCPMPGSGGALYSSRPPSTIAEHHARLLLMQRSQQMLVSPEAAEQPHSDLGSTMNALVTETPPNVTLLPRGDYHPSIYQTNQMGSNYGTIKITSSQQNPMLSRQLSVGGSGGYVHAGGVATHSAAALHTPATPQPYLRAPRPHPVGGYYEEGGAGPGDCSEYARCTPLPPHAPHAPHLPHPYRSPGHLHCPGNGSPGVAGGGGGAGGTSEYVRNELRAVVGARSARPDLHPLQPPDMDSIMSFDIAPPEYYGSGLGGGGSGGGGR